MPSRQKLGIISENKVIKQTCATHYFLPFLGQKLTKSQEEALANLDENAKLTEKIMVKYRRLIGILIPFIFFQVCWWCLAFKHDYFTLFPDRYILSLTMVLGATVAGKKHVNIKLPLICTLMLIYDSRLPVL